VPPVGYSSSKTNTEEITMQILQPPGWPRPKGYSNGVAASGRMVFLADPSGGSGNTSHHRHWRREHADGDAINHV